MRRVVTLIGRLLIVLCPLWALKRWMLRFFCGYKVAASARIGLSWFFPQRLIMEERAVVGHLSRCGEIDLVHLKEGAVIGNLNWITGLPSGIGDYFKHRPDRRPQLVVGRESSVTGRHLIDCTDQVIIGDMTTVAGNHSQILTHSVDIIESRQDCKPVTIGHHAFIGTNCVLLPGSKVPSNCVVGAKSLVNKAFVDEFTLYGGVPAEKVKSLSADSKYFLRTSGWIY